VVVGRKRRVARAVDAAEEATGLQFCVYLGPRRDPNELLAEVQPDVLVAVAPKEHYVEVVTAPGIQDRIPDQACEAAIERMVEDFRRKRYDRGIVRGVEHLAEVAGRGEAAPDAVERPDVLD
jgi:hypothetical protein